MKLAVPDLISNSYFPAIVATELGFFKEEGLNVSLERISPVEKAYAALRDGAVDFVAGSAHSALAAFPDWVGVKLLCAQAQGMYWFLVMHADPGRRTDASIFHAPEVAALCSDIGMHNQEPVHALRLCAQELDVAPLGKTGDEEVSRTTDELQAAVAHGRERMLDRHDQFQGDVEPVSYTHLTLPTILRV